MKKRGFSSNTTPTSARPPEEERLVSQNESPDYRGEVQIVWSPLTESRRRRLGMSKLERRALGKRAYIAYLQGPDPLWIATVGSRSKGWFWTVCTSSSSGEDDDLDRARDAAVREFWKLVLQSTRPDCGHERTAHHDSRRMECRSCGCGHGIGSSLWARLSFLENP